MVEKGNNYFCMKHDCFYLRDIYIYIYSVCVIRCVYIYTPMHTNHLVLAKNKKNNIETEIVILINHQTINY